VQIKHIHISGFGQFTDADFDVATGWQVFSGHNEAGKSTLRAFIKGVLFGYPAGRGAGNTYEPKVKNQPYGGWLDVVVATRMYRITRTNRTSSELTIIALDTQENITNSEEWLQAQLAPLHKQDFEAIYDFNQADLQAITQMSGEDVQRVLLNVGAPGAQDWLDVKSDLEKQADRQFAQRATKKPINQAIQAWQAQVDQQVAVTQELQVTHDLEAQRDGLQQEVQAATETLQTAQQHLDQQQTLQRAYGLYQEQADLQQQIHVHVAHQQVPVSRSQLEALLLQQREIAQLEQQLSDIGTLTAPKTPQEPQHLAHWAQRYQALQAQLTYELTPQADVLAAKEQERVTFWQQQGWQSQEDVQAALQGQPYPRWQGLSLIGAALALIILGNWLAWPSILLLVLSIGIAGGIYLLVSKQSVAPDVQAAVQRDQALQHSITEQQQQLRQQADRLQRELEVAVDELELSLPLVDVWQDGPNVLAAIASFVQEHQTVQQQYQQQLHAFHGQQAQRAELATTLQAKQHDFQEQLRQFDVHDVKTLQLHYQQQTQLETLKQRIADITAQIPTELQTQLAEIGDAAEIQQRVADAQVKRDVAQQAILNKQQTLAQVQAQLAQRVNDATVLQLTQQVADQQNTITEALQHYLSQKLAAKVIDRALSLGTQERFPKMQALAQQILSELTQGRYETIVFDHNTLQVQREDGQRFSVTELSTGTQEQIYVALRLALVQVMHDQIQLPLLIDDGFVHFDPQRREAVLHILANIADQQQVIYWTADTAFQHAAAKVTQLGEV
jgi:uncharacterized protein YhaN